MCPGFRCLEWVAVCPAEGAVQMALPRMIAARVPESGRILTWAFAAGVAALFLWIVGFAKTQGYWKSDISNGVYRQLVPHANEARHPMPGDPALQE
jgi:hypothetical protein